MSEEAKKEMEEKSIDELLSEAEARISALEGGRLSLEAAFKAYQEGMNLLKASSEKIDMVEKKVQQLNSQGELSPFDEPDTEGDDGQ
ncbi:MAG: exodeoxyribonuclease VII small subunit [Lachnospiraceae bacterium]|nr:exodeoxyribonuclease VII small subunit [Lachnospiraceae bacterium]